MQADFVLLLFFIAVGVSTASYTAGRWIERRRQHAAWGSERATLHSAVAALQGDRDHLLRKLEAVTGLCPGCKRPASECPCRAR